MATKSPKAKITPDLLVWARKSASLTLEEGAKAAGTSVAKLQAWEAGDDQPSMRQLRLLANKYKRPTAIFYLAERPTDFKPLKDFRRLPGQIAGTMSYRLAIEIRQAQERRLSALELFQDLNELPPELKIPKLRGTDPERLAKTIRKALDVSLPAQKTWGNGPDGFRAWRETIEAAGVLVFQTSEVPRQEARGFAVAHDVLPIIAVNNADAPNAKTFSLVHELAHIALRESGLTDFRLINEDDERPPEAKAIEVFCNAIAAAVLMPRESFASDERVAHHKDRSNWPDETLESLARDFNVSPEAVVRRLLTFDLTTKAFYRRKREEFNQRADDWLKAQREKNRASKGGPQPYRMTMATMGATFSRLVITTYHSGRITLADATDYLQLRAPQFAKLEEVAFTRGT